MKTIKIIIILVILGFNNTFAQVNTTIESVFVNSTTYNNCSLIDFGTTSNNSLTFYYKLTKPSGQAIGNSTLRIVLKYNSSSFGSERGNITILSNSWTNNNTERIGTIACNISESEIQTTGSSIFIEFTSDSGLKTSSCEYPLKKTLPPSFTFSPTSLSLACGDTSSRTFTVTPANIPSGASVTYQWSYSSWSIVSSTATSLTLQPSSANSLPSNVSVTPYINGVPQPTKTCTVSRSEFISTATISGSVSICTPATSSSYSIANLGVGNTIAWSSSNTAVATVSATTGNNITVNKVSDGTFNLIARITNPCGQFVDVPKLVRFGGAPVFVVSSGWIPQQPNISRISMISVDPNIPLSAEGITATTWIEKLANGTTRDCKTGTGLFTATVLYNSQDVTVTATNSCGTSTQVISILDLFGQGLKFIQSTTVSSKVLFKTFPNPSKGIINIEIENTELSTNTKNIEAQLYDMMGQLRTKVEIIDNKATFNVRDYPKGLYFLKINIEGEIETKQIIIE